jgi:hypothetical protein
VKYLKGSFTKDARQARALGLPFEILGTFMGICNAAQICQLQTQLDQLTTSHNKLVEIIQKHDKSIDQLDKSISTATSLLGAMVHHNPIYIANHLDRFTGQLKYRLTMATHFIKQSQHR